MKRFGMALLAITALGVTAACGTHVAGRALSARLPAVETPSYATSLDAGSRKFVTTIAALRMLDPCGFLDQSALAAIGRVKTVDALRSDFGCWAEFEKAVVGVEFVPTAAKKVSKPTEIQLEGTTVFEASEGNEATQMCFHFVPFVSGFDVRIDVRQNGASAVCKQLRKVTASAITRLDNKPLRQTSGHHAFHSTAVSDPCLAIKAATGSGQSTIDAETTALGSCWFTTSDGNFVTIDLSSEKPASEPRRSEKTVDIDGRPATQSTTSYSCTIAIRTGDPHTGEKFDPVLSYEGTELIPTVTVNAATCDRAVGIARLAVAAFLDASK
ncbi:MAG: hypothetical protein LLG14_03815 [Nocardiaceae bacterium]|nr:hypothetical protein [Nocardiaceae bacterium]